MRNSLRRFLHLACGFAFGLDRQLLVVVVVVVQWYWTTKALKIDQGGGNPACAVSLLVASLALE